MFASETWTSVQFSGYFSSEKSPNMQYSPVLPVKSWILLLLPHISFEQYPCRGHPAFRRSQCQWKRNEKREERKRGKKERGKESRKNELEPMPNGHICRLSRGWSRETPWAHPLWSIGLMVKATILALSAVNLSVKADSLLWMENRPEE